MANTFENTVGQMARGIMRVLSQELRFAPSINMQFDSEWGRDGREFGDTLYFRRPMQFTVSRGNNLTYQDLSEKKQEVSFVEKYNIPFAITSIERFTDIRELNRRVFRPAGIRLAAEIEKDLINMIYETPYLVKSPSSGMNLKTISESQQLLTQNLCPDGMRTLLLTPSDNTALNDALKGLYNPPNNLNRAFRSGYVASNFQGYQNVFNTTLIPRHTSGVYLSSSSPLLVAGASQSGSSITVDGGASTDTLKVGDVVFFHNVKAVHAQTKTAYDYDAPFVVTEDFTRGANTTVPLKIFPEMIASGPYQNVSNVPADNAQVYKKANTLGSLSHMAASYAHVPSIGYHKDAFTMVMADLGNDAPGAESANIRWRNISIRLTKQYQQDKSRTGYNLECYCGYAPMFWEHAVRIYGE